MITKVETMNTPKFIERIFKIDCVVSDDHMAHFNYHQRPFRLSGLFVWEPAADMKVTSLQVGNVEHLVMPLPGRLIQTLCEFADLEELAEMGRLIWFLGERDYTTANRGTPINITIKGKCKAVAIYGRELIV